jgi:hypothetical protein
MLECVLVAEFRKTKGGIKMHTLYDVKTSIPSFICISKASLHDVDMYYETGEYYILDRAYNDYDRFLQNTSRLNLFSYQDKGQSQFPQNVTQ